MNDYILGKENRIDIKSLNFDELTAFIKEIGEPAFRAKQLYDWMHVKRARNYDEMKNIPKSLKEKLEQKCSYTSLEVVQVQESQIDGTKKFLFGLYDENVIESVFMKYKFGNRHFWPEGYYVSTVGLNEATIAKYIREQEAHGIALDELIVGEW